VTTGYQSPLHYRGTKADCKMSIRNCNHSHNHIHFVLVSRHHPSPPCFFCNGVCLLNLPVVVTLTFTLLCAPARVPAQPTCCCHSYVYALVHPRSCSCSTYLLLPLLRLRPCVPPLVCLLNLPVVATLTFTLLCTSVCVIAHLYTLVCTSRLLPQPQACCLLFLLFYFRARIWSCSSSNNGLLWLVLRSHFRPHLLVWQLKPQPVVSYKFLYGLEGVLFQEEVGDEHVCWRGPSCCFLDTTVNRFRTPALVRCLFCKFPSPSTSLLPPLPLII